MKTLQSLILAFLSAVLAAPALAQSGTAVTGIVGRLDYDTHPTGNTIVYLNPAVSMCGSGSPIIATLLASDPGFSTSLAALNLAKLTVGTVVVYSNLVGGVCQITYVVAN